MNRYACIYDSPTTPAGFIPAMWRSGGEGGFSPKNDGFYEYTSKTADMYVAELKKLPPETLPVLNLERTILSTGLVSPGPAKDKLMLSVAGMIRRRICKDRPMLTYGTNATIPPSLIGHAIEPTRANWLAMLDRIRQQLPLFRVCGTIEANLYISDAPGDPNRPAGGSVERDIGYFIQQVKVIRSVVRDLQIIAWVCGNSVVTETKLPAETCAQVIAAVKEWADGIIVWGTAAGSDLMLAAAAG
jgi:hypothetical protein